MSRFPKQNRLLRSEQFRLVFDRRTSVADDVLILYGCENELPTTRLGLAVSRKVGSAVVRNKWKRLIREAFRLNHLELPGGIDIIALPRRGARPAQVPIQRSLVALVERLHKRLKRNHKS